ncbi:MAG: DUF721 domain-containing protein [Phycisphaerae bacterium]|jgi:hypothetical protein
MDGDFILEQANKKIVGHRQPASLPLGNDVYDYLGRFAKNTDKNIEILNLFEQIAGQEITAHCQLDSIRAGVLKVKVKPGPYMFHLRNRTDEILRQLQETCPSANIREIRLLCLK